MKHTITRLILAVLMANCLFTVGCEEQDEHGAPPTNFTSTEWMDALGVVADAQGVNGAAPYSPGNSVKVVGLSYGEVRPGEWHVKISAYPLPGSWQAHELEEVQLVVLVWVTTVDTGIEYTGGGHFLHKSWRIELREALTARLVASTTIAGDNDAPESFTSSSFGANVDDEDTINAPFIAWLRPYVEL